MARIFLDANIIFSSCNSASQLHRLFLYLAHHHTLLSSDYALEEARRNLELKRPAWHTTLAQLQPHIQLIPSPATENSLLHYLPEKDVPILSGAMVSKADYLLTGDRRDFGHLYDTNVQGVVIVSPLALAQLLLVK